jgi:hypothetical protein
VAVSASCGLRANVGDVLLESAAAAAVTSSVHARESGAESSDGSDREEDHQKRSSHGRSPQTE